MMQWAANKKTGFTIVELLIVIVVIAILAAITLVAYNGIRERALDSQLKTALSQANKKVLAYAAQNSDQYPDTLAQAGVSDSATAVYQFTSDNTTTPKRYAITATSGPNGPLSYYVSNTQSQATSGIAPGQNTIVWYETVANAPLPLAGGVVEATSGINSTKAIRIGPSNTGVGVSGSPFSVTQGQVFTLEFMMRTDSDWNGTSNNSKVRFANSSGPTKVCSYSGVKATWTKISCAYTVDAATTSLTLSVGNDGSVGSIWLDDISLSIQ